MPGSILNDTKKLLGIEADYPAFDLDILMHINSVFSTLHQLGVGPEEPFSIQDDKTDWSAFLGENKHINSVRSYIFLKVRLLFDPPATSFSQEAFKKQAEEYEWRLNVACDTRPVIPDFSAETVWTLPSGEPFPDEADEGDLGYDPVTGNLWRKR